MKQLMLCLVFLWATGAAAQAPKRAASSAKAKPKPLLNVKIVYAYDALCGWCYGFSPVMAQLAADHPEATIEVLSGGMITGSRMGPIGQVAPYIKRAYKDVENATGVVFGQGFLQGILEPGTAYFSSLKPSYALTQLKRQAPEKQLAFAARLQKAVYSDGIQPDDYNSYGPLAAEFGLDDQAFVKAMQDTAIHAATQAEFERVSRLGVQGFPTVFLQKPDGKLVMVAHGYVPYAQLVKRIQAAM